MSDRTHNERMTEMLEDFRQDGHEIEAFHELYEYAEELHLRVLALEQEDARGDALAYADELAAELERERSRSSALLSTVDKLNEDLRLNLDSLWRTLQAKQAAELVVEHARRAAESTDDALGQIVSYPELVDALSAYDAINQGSRGAGEGVG